MYRSNFSICPTEAGHNLIVNLYTKTILNYELTTESPWGITIGEQVPFYIKVSNVKFTPIHNYRPEYGGMEVNTNKAGNRLSPTDPAYKIDTNLSKFLDIRTGDQKDTRTITIEK